MPKVYFSLKQANELIKKHRKDVERLSDLNEELALLDNTKIEFDDESTENFLLEVELNKHFHERNVELYTLLGFLIREGFVVRDLDRMEIDFYSKYNNREVLLCWRPAEEQIQFWHYPNEDISKRRPIKEIEEAYLERLNKLK